MATYIPQDVHVVPVRVCYSTVLHIYICIEGLGMEACFVNIACRSLSIYIYMYRNKGSS